MVIQMPRTNESFDQPLRNKAIFLMMIIQTFLFQALNMMSFIKDYDLTHQDLIPFIPLKTDEVVASELQIHYLGYYIKWHPQECFYLVEKGGFECSPERTCELIQNLTLLMIKLMTLFLYNLYKIWNRKSNLR